MTDFERPSEEIVDAIIPDDRSDAESQRRLIGRLKTISIIAIVLGGLGLMTCFTSVVSVLLSEQMQKLAFPVNMGELDPEAVELQKEMQEAIYGAQRQHRTKLLATSGAHFVVTMLLLVGGIQCLRKKSSGRSCLLVAAALAIVFELGRGAVQAMIQLQQASIVSSMMTRVFEASGDEVPPQFGQTMATFTTVGIVIGLAIGGILILAKVIFYVYTVVFLKKPAVRELFSSA